MLLESLALLLLLALPPRAEAFPIAPLTLWELTQGSELVVWADVEEVREATCEHAGTDLDDRDVARLRVREVWKGQARQGDTLEVHFTAGLICPAPARFESGLSVVAFLFQWKGEWRSVGLSYGTRYPVSEDEVEAYRTAVTSAHETLEQWIQARVVGRWIDMSAARTDWRVRAAMHPATRWDGLYGLVPEADEDHAFYDRLFRLTSGERPLSSKQREALAQGFVEHPPLDRALPMMLMALRGDENAAVDHAAESALETLLAEDEIPRWAARAFDFIRERHGERPAERTEPEEDPVERTMTDASSGLEGPRLPGNHPLAREWQDFKQRHHLEPRPLPRPDDSPVPGTGGETPL